MITFWEFLKAVPTLLKLVDIIIAANKEAETKIKVADSVNKINEAYRERDAEKLNAIFNSK